METEEANLLFFIKMLFTGNGKNYHIIISGESMEDNGDREGTNYNVNLNRELTYSASTLNLLNF